MGCHQSAQANQTAATQPAPFATPPVLAGTPDVATLVARVRPAVVNITTTHAIKLTRGPMQMPFGFDFGGPGGDESGPQLMPRDGTLEQKALGTGVLSIDADGHVVTNAHVIDGADDVRVKLSDERELEAKVKGRDARLDLAVLELQDAKDLPGARVARDERGAPRRRVRRRDRQPVRPRQHGHDGDRERQGRGRSAPARTTTSSRRTRPSTPETAAARSSTCRAQVVGINTAINPPGKGIGFAIPIDAVKHALRSSSRGVTSSAATSAS